MNLTSARMARYQWWRDWQPRNSTNWRVALRVSNDVHFHVGAPLGDQVEDRVFWAIRVRMQQPHATHRFNTDRILETRG